MIVVGGGLIGSAAARHLQEAGHDVLLLTGASEPVSSHDDRFRVQSVRGKDAWWTALNEASVAFWPTLEARTGIRFHHPVGCVWSEGEVTPWGEGGRYEPAPAGVIAPKALITAQQRAFVAAGGRIEPATARLVAPGRVETDRGLREAPHILVAAGVMSPFVLGRTPAALDLQIETETVIQARLDGPIALPALLHDGPHSNLEAAWDLYATPPIPDASGAAWVKLGANLLGDRILDTPEAIRSWITDDDATRATVESQRAILETVLRMVLPESILRGRQIRETRTKRCIIARTSTGRPHIRTLERTDAGAVHVAIGGNGYGAMCSEALGARAARLVG